MFRAGFQSSLDLESALSLIYLCEVLFDINDTVPEWVYCVKLCVVLTNTRTVLLCEIRFDSDECLNCF